MRDSQCVELFKYVNLSRDVGKLAVEQAVIKNQIYWASPDSFNDPFDCIPVLNFGKSDDERRRFYRRVAKQTHPNSPRRYRRAEAQKMAKVPPKQMEADLCAQWERWISNTAVTCFSEIPDHPLMWGHYGNCHRGVCLGFQEIADIDIGWFGFPVEYQDERPQVNLTSFDKEESAIQALCVKSAHWSYEREHRMIDWDGGAGLRAFPPDQLKSVILGAKISSDDEQFVRSLVAKKPRLLLYRAEIDESEFKLNVVPA